MDIFSYALGKKVGGGSKDYVDATYIESTGTQYIDTGITPDDTFKIEVEFQQTIKFGQYPKLLGSEISHGNQSLKVDIGSSNSTSYFVFYCMDKEYNISGTTYGTPHIFKYEKGKVSYDGNDTTFTETRTLNSGMNMYLFAGNRNGDAIEFGALKMYYCKIWKNGQLVRDFVPRFRLRDYKFGLYDNVSGEFFANSGTGSFGGNL